MKMLDDQPVYDAADARWSTLTVEQVGAAIEAHVQAVLAARGPHDHPEHQCSDYCAGDIVARWSPDGLLSLEAEMLERKG